MRKMLSKISPYISNNFLWLKNSKSKKEPFLGVLIDFHQQNKTYFWQLKPWSSTYSKYDKSHQKKVEKKLSTWGLTLMKEMWIGSILIQKRQMEFDKALMD